ncbi:MAG: DegT/DnrJ/EryC1/StrS family aminotransferase [Planctomycetota bacterium]|jgi:dTDP-4-amino-4,6-dideoxygalactose transaminase
MITLGDWNATDLTREKINDVLDRGRLTYGPVQQEFERRFARLHNCKHAILSNSGTSSLQVAIQAMKIMYRWNDWDEVIVPATTFVATVNAILHNNLTPVLVDVDPYYYYINSIPKLGTTSIGEVITNKTRLIIPVHPFGLPAEVEFIETIADEFKLKVIEDACETMFVSREGKSVGSWGDAAAFSHYMAHILVAGVGGTTTVREDDDLAKLCRSLVNHGISLDELPSGEEYDHTWMARNFLFRYQGHSFRITEMEAAIALAELETWDKMMNTRAINAKRLTNALQDLEDEGFIQLPSIPYNSDHAWMVYPIVLDRPSILVRKHLAEKKAAETRTMLPLVTQPCYDFIDPEDFPVSLNLARKGIYIGCHHYVTEDQINYFSEVMHGYYGK